MHRTVTQQCVGYLCPRCGTLATVEVMKPDENDAEIMRLRLQLQAEQPTFTELLKMKGRFYKTADEVIADDGATVWLPYWRDEDHRPAEGVVRFRVHSDVGLHFIGSSYSTEGAAAAKIAARERKS